MYTTDENFLRSFSIIRSRIWPIRKKQNANKHRFNCLCVQISLFYVILCYHSINDWNKLFGRKYSNRQDFKSQYRHNKVQWNLSKAKLTPLLQKNIRFI